MPKKKPSHQIEMQAIETLIPYVNNSRTHSESQVSQVAASIKEFGFTNPVLIDDDNMIIAGHGRIQAAMRLGLTEVPCIKLSHLNENQKKAYIIADNKLALNAGWDEDLLRLELGNLDENDFDLSLTGFDDDELKNLLLPEQVNGLVDEDQVPEVPKEPVTVEGDIWILGNHRLICGDSTMIDVMQRLSQGQMVDLWITDPPYNVAYEGGTKDKLQIKNDNMEDELFRQFLTDAFSAANMIMKPGGAFYIWHADMESYNFRGAVKDAGLHVRQCLIWKKSSLVIGRQDFQWKHEPCLYGWKEGAAHLWTNDRSQTTILEFNKPKRNGEHPTMKPVELFEYQINNNTRGMDLVLDNFGGSGTTIIACEKIGRRSLVAELDPKYCDVIIKRWQDFTGKEAVHEDGRKFNDLRKDDD